ncbi:hypothetical protein JCM30237_11630 [Halolamina litorea]|uniref:Uncharacterized protein n=1 Tax=Halolamina litorea TaxID=1515593 RepID=A0ABD6BLC6_9EURY|nr:hypothetical protein [Halolamina litorea]
MVPGIVTQVPLLFGALWLANALVLSPILLSTAVRRLIRSWPTDGLPSNYLVATAAFTATHLSGLALTVAFNGGRLAGREIGWLAGVTLVNLVLWWAAVALAVPGLGHWHPKADGEYDGRIALTLELFAYVAATGALAFVVLVVAIAVGFPG